MYCYQCGKQIPDGSRFCNFCGSNLTAIQSAPRPAPVQADPFFDIRHGVLVKYTGRDKNVVVPDGVVEVEENAFTGYDIESITFPEGCRKVRIKTYVKVIRFPASIERFWLWGKGFRTRPADDVFFAPGTKKIVGSSTDYKIDTRFSARREQVMALHIPNSVEDIRELHCRHYTEIGDSTYYYFDYLVYDNIDDFSPEMRRQIYQWKDKCAYCGGNFKNTMFGNQKCNTCGKKKDYDFNGVRWVSK